MGPGEASQPPGPEPTTHSQRVHGSRYRRGQLTRLTAGALRPTGTPPVGGGLGTARQLEGGKETPRQNWQGFRVQTAFGGTILPEAMPTRSPGQGSRPRPSLWVSLLLSYGGVQRPCSLSLPLLSGSNCHLLLTEGRATEGPPCSGTSVEKTLGAGWERRPLAVSLFITSFTSSVQAPQFQPERSREK